MMVTIHATNFHVHKKLWTFNPNTYWLYTVKTTDWLFNYRVVTLVAGLILISEANCIKQAGKVVSLLIPPLFLILEWGNIKETGSLIQLASSTKVCNQGNHSAGQANNDLSMLRPFGLMIASIKQLGAGQCQAQGWSLFYIALWQSFLAKKTKL